MKQQTVCVVGGGISGIVAAHTLKEKGHEVTVFERGRTLIFHEDDEIVPPVHDRSVGGKCFSPTINGRSYELGACSCSPEFKTVIELARKTRTRLRKRMPFRVIDTSGNKVSFRKCYWPKGETLQIMREMAVYLFHSLKFQLFHDRNDRYTSIPERYRSSFREFCRSSGIKIIPAWFELPVTSFGYGRLEEIRTWFVFNYINPLNFMGIAVLLILLGIPPVRRFDRGYETLVTHLAQGLDVRRRHEVMNIRRDGPVRVTVKNLDDNSLSTHEYDAVVVSVPLPRIIDAMDADDEEKRLSRAVRLLPYTIVACRINAVNDECLLWAANVNRPGHIALIEETVAGEHGICVCYIPESSHERSIQEIIDGVNNDLSKLGYSLGTIFTIKKWHYFPHFMDADQYTAFQDLQGKRDTFHVGGLAKFELSERVAAHARALMDTRFPGKRKKEAFTTLKNYLYFYFQSLERTH